MSRAVHGFQSKQLLLHLKGEHVLAVVLPVTRSHPEPAVVNVWGDHLLESSFSIFTPDEFDKRIINIRSLRQEKATSRAEFMEEIQFLVLGKRKAKNAHTCITST